MAMRKFIIRGFLYLLPFIVAILTVYIVDPYYLFTGEDQFDEQKYLVGYSYDQGRRYKIFTYFNNPTDNIILGASEINIISEHNIPEEGWHSLSYGGAPLQESLRMYWVAQNKHKLKKVIIAPEFIKYYNAISSTTGDPYYANFTWEVSQSAKAIEIYDNKLDYFVDKYTIESTLQCIKSLVGDKSSRSKPQGSKEDFWQSQLDYAEQQYSGDIFPEKKQEIWALFSAIKEDAERRGVEIRIVLPIQHIDLLRLEFQDVVYETYKEYIAFLTKTFGEIYYMAFSEDISNNQDCFSDPFHCIMEEYYVDKLFGKHRITPLNEEKAMEFLDFIRRYLSNHE